MFTGFIDIDGNHAKDGLKNDLRTTRLLREEGWRNSPNGGYVRDLSDTTESTMLVNGERVAGTPVSEWKIHQVWWSTVPDKPMWKRRFLAYWLRIKECMLSLFGVRDK